MQIYLENTSGIFFRRLVIQFALRTLEVPADHILAIIIFAPAANNERKKGETSRMSLVYFLELGYIVFDKNARGFC